MIVLHVPFSYYPDPVGGTEVYVTALAQEQQHRGVSAVIAAPGAHDEAYFHGGLPVRRFGSSPALGLGELYGKGDPVAAAAFAHILDAERPDLVHLHAFTSAVSPLLLRQVKLRGLPVVFTYHTPTVSCQRGTLLRWGNTVCDGRLDTRRCGACTLHGKGVRKPISQGIAALPVALGQALGALDLAGGAWTALRMPALVEQRHAALHTLLSEVDAIVALCAWTRTLLLANGAAPEKLFLSRHGLALRQPTGTPPRAAHGDGRLHVACIGRLDPTKGVDVLIAALRSSPQAQVQLDIYGIVQAGSEQYASELHALAAQDARVTFLKPVPNEQVHDLLGNYDILAVPSQILETGPLVVLEAFAAGLPVLGSNLGGIAELVTGGVDGLLVAPADSNGWKSALEQLSTDPALLVRLRAGVRPPRSTLAVSDDMLALYTRTISALRASAPPYILQSTAEGA